MIGEDSGISFLKEDLLPIDQMKFREVKSTVYLWIIAIPSDFSTKLDNL